MDATQDIKEYLDRLPPVIRDAVLADEWRKRLGQIAAKYSLHLDQISALEYETMFVLIGMEAEDDFVENIEHELGVSKILAKELANEVGERVFKYILKLMEEKSAPAAKRFEPVATSPTLPNTALLTEMENMASQTVPHQSKVAEPPMNLPGTEEPQPEPSTVVQRPKPLVKAYAADPYREPLE
jgi:hypothetical protein